MIESRAASSRRILNHPRRLVVLRWVCTSGGGNTMLGTHYEATLPAASVP